jgi:hypothetical protein
VYRRVCFHEQEGQGGLESRNRKTSAVVGGSGRLLSLILQTNDIAISDPAPSVAGLHFFKVEYRC